MPNVTLQNLVDELVQRRALDLRGYKKTTLERRIRRRMQETGVEYFGQYLDKIDSDPHEVNELLNTILINVTEFFRDPQGWEALRNEYVRKLAERLRPGDVFRAWSAG